MRPYSGMSNRLTLPLPAFVLHPLTALVIAAIHVYLASGHLAKLFGGAIQWTDIWKGSGALAGACVFAALVSRGIAARSERQGTYTRLRNAEQ
jgi:tagatose-1,6-bisphosphate aldolase